MISNQFQHALPHAVMSKSLQMTWKTANLVSFYAWRNTKTLFKGFKYFRGDLLHQLQNYLIKILTNCQLIMSIWVPVEKNQCKNSIRPWNIQETWTFRQFWVASSLLWTQHIKTNITITLQNVFHNNTWILLQQVWEWSYLYECQSQIVRSSLSSSTPITPYWLHQFQTVSDSEWTYIRICPKFWAIHYTNICAEFLLQFWKQQGDSVMMLARTQET